MDPCPSCKESKVGKKVTFPKCPNWGEFEVTSDLGYVGVDGRHWLGLRKEPWELHSPCTEVTFV